MIKALFRSILFSGLRESYLDERLKKVYLTNLLATVCICLVIPHFFMFIYLGYSVLGYIMVFFIILCSTVICLNRYHCFFQAQVLMIITMTLTFYICSCVFGPDIGFQHIHLCTISIIYAVIPPKSRVYLIPIPILVFCFSEFTDYEFFFYHVQVSSRLALFLPFSIVLSGFLMLIIPLQFLFRLHEDSKKYLEGILMHYFTPKETEVAFKILEGKTNKQISEDLFIEEGTVKTHLKNIFKKANVKNRLELSLLLSNINRLTPSDK